MNIEEIEKEKQKITREKRRWDSSKYTIHTIEIALQESITKTKYNVKSWWQVAYVERAFGK